MLRGLTASVLVLFAAISGCQPTDRCSGTLYFDEPSDTCRTCPKGATFSGGTCQCMPQYEFKNNVCVLMDGAVVEPPDAGASDGGAATDAAAPAANGCNDYCDFNKVCFGQNPLAQQVLPDIVSGIHADDTAACSSSCKDNLGNDGAGDPVIACIQDGRDSAGCANDTTQNGLLAWFSLISSCCGAHPKDAVCKSLCDSLKSNALASGMATFCN